MSDDEFNPGTGELVCGSDRLLRITGVIDFAQNDFLTVDATRCIDVGDSLFGTVVATKNGVFAGQGADQADSDVGMGFWCNQKEGRENQQKFFQDVSV